MDAALDEELRALRKRAYGRDADLSQDPAAVERLHELESLRAATAAASITDDDTDDDAAARADVREQLEALDGSGASLRVFEVDPASADASPGSPAATSRARRRRTAAWVGSVIAAAAIASAVTWAAVAVSPVVTASGARQIDALEPTAGSDFSPEEFGGDADSPVWEYHGLTMFVGPAGLPGDEAARCLSIYVVDDDSGGYGGWGHTGCAAGKFPAQITLSLGPNLPEELLDAFPGRKALQFVLDDDRIGVFVDE